MKHTGRSLLAQWVLLGAVARGAVACGAGPDSSQVRAPSTKTRLDLADLESNPDHHAWFDFRPNVKKLILSGAAETEHVAILWYTVSDGSVGMHYHAKTESVFVIRGTQTDAKGVYPTGTVYFNPPGSGHAISNSSGFFILAYASPPDFTGLERIGEYEPVRIDTTDPRLTSVYPFAEVAAGVRSFQAPLDPSGGLRGQLIELAPGSGGYEYLGNYLLVLGGRCGVDGAVQAARTLVVAEALVPEPFALTTVDGSACLALGVSF